MTGPEENMEYFLKFLNIFPTSNETRTNLKETLVKSIFLLHILVLFNLLIFVGCENQTDKSSSNVRLQFVNASANMTGDICFESVFGDQCSYLGSPGTDSHGWIFLKISHDLDSYKGSVFNESSIFKFRSSSGKQYIGALSTTSSNAEYVTIIFSEIASVSPAVNQDEYRKDTGEIDVEVDYCMDNENSHYTQYCNSATQQ